MTRPERIALKGVAWVLCLLPLTILAFRTFTGDLGANPISFITDWLGQWTFRLLLATLALTPLRILFGLSWPISLRRLLGQMIVRAPVRRPGGDSSVADDCPAGYQGRGRPGSHREQYPGLPDNQGRPNGLPRHGTGLRPSGLPVLPRSQPRQMPPHLPDRPIPKVYWVGGVRRSV
ncbi:MAG: hypothetical protein ACHQ7N_18390 [Candidatus Methylomirabilales bacterium]